MLGKLLGISPKKPSLPKNQIEVVCPVCGSAQREPRLVVTTVCRQCGEHLRIEKKKVIASSQINPVPSAIYPAYNESRAASSNASQPAQARDSSPPEIKQEPLPTHTIPPIALNPPSALLPTSPDNKVVDIPEEPGLGNFLMRTNGSDTATNEVQIHEGSQSNVEKTSIVTDDVSAAINGNHSPISAEESGKVEQEHHQNELAPPTEGILHAKESPKETPASSSEALNAESSLILPQRRPRVQPLPLRQPRKRPEPVRPPEQSTFQKMREQGFRQQHFKEVECFDCHHKFKVGRSARNSICPNCSSNICMEDIEINVSSTTPIRTRGDVYIRKMGNVSTSEIKCRDLHLQGIISANVECTGELIVRTAGNIVGEIHCVRLHVVKGSDIQLINTIYTQEAEIYARICGNIHCDGPVLIGAGGCVEGDVSARSVNIEPGGHLDGSMNILRPRSKKAKPAPLSEDQTSSSEQTTLPL